MRNSCKSISDQSFYTLHLDELKLLDFLKLSDFALSHSVPLDFQGNELFAYIKKTNTFPLERTRSFLLFSTLEPFRLSSQESLAYDTGWYSPLRSSLFWRLLLEFLRLFFAIHTPRPFWSQAFFKLSLSPHNQCISFHKACILFDCCLNSIDYTFYNLSLFNFCLYNPADLIGCESRSRSGNAGVGRKFGLVVHSLTGFKKRNEFIITLLLSSIKCFEVSIHFLIY